MSNSSPSAPDGAFVAQRVTLDGAVSITHPPSGKQHKDGWDILAALSPILSGVIVAIVAYFLTDSVNTALKRQELQLSNVTEMRTQLLALEGSKEEEWRPAAFTLSAFGEPAVTPLFSALTTADEARGPLIEAALRGIGASHAKTVCTPMISVLDNRTGRYTFLMHHSAIRLIGDLGCAEAEPTLRRYESVVKGAISTGNLATYSALISPDVPVTALGLQLISQDLERTLSVVVDAKTQR